jgi:hypothetical protein
VTNGVTSASPAQPSATEPAARTADCPTQHTGQHINLTGRITAVMMIGGSFFSEVKNSHGTQCELVTHSNPGAVGATVSVQDYVAYVSPGDPPQYRIAPADYAANDH